MSSNPMSQNPTESSQYVAAVDLGSNSFHMIVGRLEKGQLQITDRLKEMVRLGAGLRPNRTLEPETQARALSCLEKFGQRLTGIPPGLVRAVGTNTLRQVKDGGDFLNRAENALGHPIDIIAGREEARLVYLGVAHALATEAKLRLVVDIGGGSTELILGRDMETRSRESLFMGCVSMSQRFFPSGKISAEAMNEALQYCRVEVRAVRHQFSAWERAIGSSGTIKAIRSILQAEGWADNVITTEGLIQLRRALVEAGHIDKVTLQGLSDERRSVICGGVAVLSAVFESLDIDQMEVSDMALREGLLFELFENQMHLEDVRDRTTTSLMQRFALNEAQADRVRLTAHALLNQVARKWQLHETECATMLSWAAQLHEIGLIISHSSFHKHGAYILENADLPGFSRRRQTLLAALVRGHRRKFPLEVFDSLPKSSKATAIRLCILLRLAVLMHRGHSNKQKPLVEIQVDEKQIKLKFPANWLAEHSLIQTELAAEAQALEKIDYRLKFS